MLKVDEIRIETSCWNKALPHERLFVLLCHDITSPAVVRFWADLRIAIGKNKPDDEQIIEALKCADLMEEEQRSLFGKTDEDFVALQKAEFTRLL